MQQILMLLPLRMERFAVATNVISNAPNYVAQSKISKKQHAIQQEKQGTMINVGGEVIKVTTILVQQLMTGNNLITNILMMEDSSSDDKPAQLVNNKPQSNLKDDHNYATPTKFKLTNQKIITTIFF